MPFDAILTANYTYELEKAISDQFKCLPARRCKARKVVYFYKPDIKPEEKLLAEAYGMIVVTEGYCGNYKAYYAWLCERLKDKLA